MAKQCENVTIPISATKGVIVLVFTLLGSSSLGGAVTGAWSDNDRARVNTLEMRCAVQEERIKQMQEVIEEIKLMRGKLETIRTDVAIIKSYIPKAQGHE